MNKFINDEMCYIGHYGIYDSHYLLKLDYNILILYDLMNLKITHLNIKSNGNCFYLARNNLEIIIIE